MSNVMDGIKRHLALFLDWLFSEEFPHRAENCRVCHNDTIDHQPGCWVGWILYRYLYT